MPTPILITGFQPYAGRGRNPAAEIATALDRTEIRGVPVMGRTLPVEHAGLQDRIANLIRELTPSIVLSVGLWPGEPVIRIERFALNLADFEIPDNTGLLLSDRALHPDAALALAATIPLRKIETALLEACIPARLSATAGTFLCNACLFASLSTASRMETPPLCGFIHVPYLPEQVAEMLRARRREAEVELHQWADLASMPLDIMFRAVRLAAEVSLKQAHGG